MRENVTRIRKILEEAVEEKLRKTPEIELRRDFQLYQCNVDMAPIEQSARARSERETHRIAMTYGWQSEVARFLDGYGAASLAGLDDDQVEQLVGHMRKLLDRAMSACDFDEALPAR